MLGDPQKGWDDGLGSSAPGRALWQLHGERENHGELEDAPGWESGPGPGTNPNLRLLWTSCFPPGLCLSSVKKQEPTPSSL